MVREIENFADKFERLNLKSAADRLRATASQMYDEGIIPENLVNFLPTYHHPQFDYFEDDGYVFSGGQRRELSLHENQIMNLLTGRPNRVVNYQDFFRVLWRADENVNEFYLGRFKMALRGMVSGLRGKVSTEERPEVITSVRKKGYKLIDPESVAEVGAERISEKAELVYSHPAFTFYPERVCVHVGDQIIPLSALENRLLDALASKPNRVRTFYELASLGWGMDLPDDMSPNIRTHISHLRTKISKGGHEGNGKYFKNVSGVGYMLVYPENQKAD